MDEQSPQSASGGRWSRKKVKVLVSQSCLTLQPQPARLLCPSDSPSKNTGVGCHALLQGIFLTQGSNPRLLCLLDCQADSLLPAPHGKPIRNTDVPNGRASKYMHRKATELKKNCQFNNNRDFNTHIYNNLQYN